MRRARHCTPKLRAGALLIGIFVAAAACAEIAAPDKVTLEHGPYVAVFPKAAQYELSEIRTKGGAAIPVKTSVRLRLVSDDAAVDADAEVAEGDDIQLKRVIHSPERLAVEYQQGDFRFEHSFAWDGDALALHRRVTCLRAARTKRPWNVHEVAFGRALSRVVYEHGFETPEKPLPPKEWTQIPGNWLAAGGEDAASDGVAVLFPRRALFGYRLDARRFTISETRRFEFDEPALAPGVEVEHELWLTPIRSGALADEARTAIQTLCARLTGRKDPTTRLFARVHVSPGLRGQTLASREGLTVWESDASEMVPERVAPPAERAEGIRLALARGETEPIHLVLAPAQGMAEVTVTCAPLTTGAEQIADSQFRVRYAAYARVRPTTAEERAKAANPATLRFVSVVDNGKDFLHSDRFFGGSAKAIGAVEDPLYDRPSVDLNPGRNQPVWITLAVPADARPGRYRGQIRVAAKDQVLCEIPLDVTVWAFTLPKVSSLRTWYQLFIKYAPVQAHWREYYRDLAEHKVSGFGAMPFEPKVELVGGKVVVDWSEFDTSAAYLFDELGFRSGKLPHGKRGGAGELFDFLGFKESTPEFEAALTDYLKQARSHLMDRGWLDRMDCYIWDEPNAPHVEPLVRTGRITRATIPEIQVLAAASHHTRPLIGILNAWCPSVASWKLPAGEFNPQRIAEDRKRGDFYWIYNSPENALGFPIIANRCLPWALWCEDVKGYFIWGINYWGTPDGLWVQKHILGEAFVLYPGLKGPVDSLRWEQTREGLEEYDYLVLLAKALETNDLSAELAGRGRAVLAQVREVFPSPHGLSTVDPRTITALRREIGDILNQHAQRRP